LEVVDLTSSRLTMVSHHGTFSWEIGPSERGNGKVSMKETVMFLVKQLELNGAFSKL